MHKRFGIGHLASLSIRKKLFWLRFGIGLCMGVIIGAAAVWMATVVLQGLARDELKTTGRLVSSQAGYAILSAGRDLVKAAGSDDMEKYYHSGRSAVLSTLFRRYTAEFDHLALYDYQGKALAAMIKGRFFEDPSLERLSGAFQEAVQKPNTLVVDGVYFDEVLESLVVGYYYNYVDYFDNPMGVMVGCISLDTLDTYLERRFARTGLLSLVIADKAGTIVFGPRKEDGGTALPPALNSPGSGARSRFTAPSGSEGEFWGEREVFGSLSLVSAHLVPDLGWQAFVIKPASLIHRALYLLFGFVFMVTMLTILCGELISRALGIRITEPIDRLIRVISDILKSGNLTQRVEWASKDEMGTLAGLFNAMLEKIDAEQIALQARRTRELEEEVAKRKKDQERLRHAIAAAEAANLAKSEFLANMSHEIRTPMNGIMGLAELALDSGLDPNQEHLVSSISSESESLLSIINTILDFSKIEAGRLELDEVAFNLRELFENLAATFAVTAGKKGLEFSAFMAPDVPESLLGDPGRLRQVLVNLVGNAIKFTHTGEVHLQVARWEKRAEGVWIEFHIEDTGIGIPEESRGIIFDSFSQADGSTTRKYGGTGLGTAISKELVEMMGGEIGFEDRKEGGTLFRFSALLGVDPACADQGTDPKISFPSGPLHVLVAMETPRANQVICRYLEALGTAPVAARDAGTALEILSGKSPEKEPVDLVVAGPHMPGRSAPFVSEVASLTAVPLVILVSANEAAALPDRDWPEGAGCLSRPLRLRELCAVLSSVAEKRPLAVFPSCGGQEGEWQGQFPSRNIQILLAEDYPTNQQVALRHLTNAGYKVKLAEDGEEAVTLFKKERFDLVLMDIQMPVLDGYAATEKIREAEEDLGLTGDLRVPIIAMTAHAVIGYREKCLAAGMDDYLTKPLKRSAMLRMVERWTEKGEAVCEGGDEEPLAIGESVVYGPPVDMNLAMREFENDRPFFLKVFRVFMESLENRMALLDTAVITGDFKTVIEQAHTVKGGAANVAAMSMYNVALSLERQARNRDREAIGRAFSAFKAEAQRLEGFGGGL